MATSPTKKQADKAYYELNRERILARAKERYLGIAQPVEPKQKKRKPRKVVQYHHTYTGCNMITCMLYWDNKPSQWIADQIGGVTEVALRRMVSVWRSKGYPIPKGKDKAIGSQSVRIRGGRQVVHIKCADGKWRVKDGLSRSEISRLGNAARNSQPRTQSLSNDNTMAKPSNLYNYMNSRTARKQKGHAERLKTRKVDPSEMVTIPVPGIRGTFIQLHRDTTPEQRAEKVRRYEQQHHAQFAGMKVVHNQGAMQW